MVALVALTGCAGDDDVRAVAEEDLRCDAVTVFPLDGPTEITRPLLERRRSGCSTYTSSRYRVEGCQRARVYDCQECPTGPKICFGVGPATVIE